VGPVPVGVRGVLQRDACVVDLDGGLRDEVALFGEPLSNPFTVTVVADRALIVSDPVIGLPGEIRAALPCLPTCSPNPGLSSFKSRPAIGSGLAMMASVVGGDAPASCRDSPENPSD
jgi:hypothetical protein